MQPELKRLPEMFTEVLCMVEACAFVALWPCALLALLRTASTPMKVLSDETLRSSSS